MSIILRPTENSTSGRNGLGCDEQEAPLQANTCLLQASQLMEQILIHFLFRSILFFFRLTYDRLDFSTNSKSDNQVGEAEENPLDHI